VLEKFYEKLLPQNPPSARDSCAAQMMCEDYFKIQIKLQYENMIAKSIKNIPLCELPNGRVLLFCSQNKTKTYKIIPICRQKWAQKMPVKQ